MPLADHDRVKDLKGVHVIGYITDEDKGCALVGRDGESEIPLRAQGFNPLAAEEVPEEPKQANVEAKSSDSEK